MITYRNTTPSQPIAAHPRAIYRITIERNGFYALDFLSRFVTWPGVVLSVIENSYTGAGFPIGNPQVAVQPSDTVAVLDYRAGSHPGSLTVADLARAVDSASKYASVKTIERRQPVTIESEGGAAAQDASRDAEQIAQRQQAADDSITARITQALQGGARAVLIAATVGVVAYFLITNAIGNVGRSSGGAK